jgi:membrane protein DedA with SNARE-associated domain
MTSNIESLGVLGVFLLMIPESACVPVPSEATLLSAGAGVAHGWFSLPVAVGAATAGNLVGSLIAYAIGRRGGIRRLPAGARHVLERCDRLFERWGLRAVFIARLLPLARTFVSLPAGTARVPLRLFIPLTTAGCALWSIGFVIAGAAGWQHLVGRVGNIALATVILGAAMLYVRYKRT